MQDADAYAAWGVDYLKYDYCHMQDVAEPPEVCGPPPWASDPCSQCSTHAAADCFLLCTPFMPELCAPQLCARVAEVSLCGKVLLLTASHATPHLQESYMRMSRALNKTGRPIHFSLCNWGVGEPWKWGSKVRP